jgi:ppGpp synthetase/RelA/SpoT-type nucleotidyltranferase
MNQQNLDNNNTKRLLKSEFDKKAILYTALGDLIKLYLNESLTSKRIPFSDIQFRVKTFHSFISKIKRKEYYDTPYEKIQDICGLRIICTFKEDMEEVTKIVSNMFIASAPDDKEQDDNSRLVGYRGIHQIVQLKPDICNSNTFYEKLQGLKAEIQIRTIAQHSWSEISHKLNYKDEDNVPTEFKHLLSDISGALGVVDRLYNSLRNEKNKLKAELRAKDIQNFNLECEVNIDTLTTFLDIFYPDRDSLDDIDLLYDEMKNNNFMFCDIVEKQKLIPTEIIAEMEKEILGTGKHTQVGFVRLILSLYYREYWESRKNILPMYPDGSVRIQIIEKWQNTLTNEH